MRVKHMAVSGQGQSVNMGGGAQSTCWLGGHCGAGTVGGSGGGTSAPQALRAPEGEWNSTVAARMSAQSIVRGPTVKSTFPLLSADQVPPVITNAAPGWDWPQVPWWICQVPCSGEIIVGKSSLATMYTFVVWVRCTAKKPVRGPGMLVFCQEATWAWSWVWQRPVVRRRERITRANAPFMLKEQSFRSGREPQIGYRTCARPMPTSCFSWIGVAVGYQAPVVLSCQTSMALVMESFSSPFPGECHVNAILPPDLFCHVCPGCRLRTGSFPWCRAICFGCSSVLVFSPCLVVIGLYVGFF